MKDFRIKLFTAILTISSQLSFGQAPPTTRMPITPSASIQNLENNTNQDLMLRVGNTTYDIKAGKRLEKNIYLDLKILKDFPGQYKTYYDLAKIFQISNPKTNQRYLLGLGVSKSIKFGLANLQVNASLAKGGQTIVSDTFIHKLKISKVTDFYKIDDHYVIDLRLFGENLENSEIDISAGITTNGLSSE
ncbi:MAG: hypothetical protein WDZ41_04780 [Candidatus Babeliales bacterium]